MEKVIIASGPVLSENDHILLNQHGDSSFWKFCGGKIENYSLSLADNAKLKVKEEMGVDVEIINDTPFITHTRKSADDGEIDVILVHFLAKRVSEEISPREDIRKWGWFPLNSLPSNLAPNILPVLEHFGFQPEIGE